MVEVGLESIEVELMIEIALELIKPGVLEALIDPALGIVIDGLTVLEELWLFLFAASMFLIGSGFLIEIGFETWSETWLEIMEILPSTWSCTGQVTLKGNFVFLLVESVRVGFGTVSLERWPDSRSVIGSVLLDSLQQQ